MSEGTEVTFVNGIAEEQTTEGQSNIPADDRAAAVAAVKEAMKAEGEKAAKEAKNSVEQDPLRPRESTERGPDGKFLKTGEKQPSKEGEAVVDPDTASLKQALAQRKQMAAQKAQFQQEQQRAMAEINAARQQFMREQAQFAEDRKRFELLRKDPIRAIKENGWDPETFILDIARDGTPEGQAARESRELREQVAEMNRWREEQAKAFQAQKQREVQQQNVQYRQDVEREFLKTSLDDAKYPNIASMYKGHEHGLIAEGDVIAEQYRNLTGKEASFDDIAEYLEERTANWYKSRSGGQQVAATQVPKGRPTQGSATGRTLTPEGSSERRSLGVTLKDLDGDERLAAAREAVAAAMNASGTRR